MSFVIGLEFILLLLGVMHLVSAFALCFLHFGSAHLSVISHVSVYVIVYVNPCVLQELRRIVEDSEILK